MMYFKRIINLNQFQINKTVFWKKYSSSADLTNVKFSNGIKRITMSDQKSRNSLSMAMMNNLLDNINKDKDNNALRVIILSAEGPVFSAGHNLKELVPEVGRKQHEKIFQLCAKLMYSMIDCPVPIIAHVDGLATAAGCQMVAQCDIVFCTENSKFSTPGANFGIFCSTPGIPIARKIQKSTALNMLLTGHPISAEEARSSGLVTKVCPSQTIEAEITKTCDAIKSKSRSVLELGKKFYYEQVDMDIRKAYQVGGMKMVENLGLEDGKEGVKSFAEKRKPVWKQ